MSPSFCAPESDFVITNCLSEGTNVSVYKATRVRDGLPVVLKVLHATSSHSLSECNGHVKGFEEIPAVPKEFLFLQKVKRLSGCVHVLDLLQNPVTRKWTLVLEDLESLGFIDLAKEISKPEFKISESTVSWIMRELIIMLSEVHSLGILHCDLKLDNVFVHFERKAVKLIDFNLSTYIKDSHAEPLSGFTAEYAPPEVLVQRKSWSVAGEVWSLGCIAFVLLCRRFPFSNPYMAAFSSPIYPECLSAHELPYSPLHPSRKLFRASAFPSFPLPQNDASWPTDKLVLSHKAKDFLVSCLCRSPEQRPSLAKLLEHPFLRVRAAIENRKQQFTEFVLENPTLIS